MFNTNYFPKIRLKYLAFLAVYDKLEICKLLLDHFDCVFTTPEPSKIIHDPKTFFTEPPVSDASYLTDINFSESVIIDAIKELSPNSAAGPDGIPASPLINCAS